MSDPYREPSPPPRDPPPPAPLKKRTGCVAIVVAVLFAVLISILSITSYEKRPARVPSGGDIMRSDQYP